MVDECANCGTALKSNMFTQNARLPERDLLFFNEMLGLQLTEACDECGIKLKEQAFVEWSKERNELRKDLEDLLDTMPLASIQSPQGWSYRVLGLVTAQSVTGTGMFSDVTSAFTDLFGAQSGTYNKKIRGGEDLCRASIRAQALQLGANAVLGIDVDYAEVGGQRAMLMVCMTGTAVILQNGDMISSIFEEQMRSIPKKRERYWTLGKMGRERNYLVA